MILYELTNREDHPVYQALEVANSNRQYDFLRSAVIASLAIGRPFLSQHLIKAFNFQAITCLHTNPGEYRPCAVEVGSYRPPQHHRVPALMDDFTNFVNRHWEQADSVFLTAYVLWRMNHIHPFINGNGRTARAASYFVLCVKSGGWLDGALILPELIRQNRAEYVEALKKADMSVAADGIDAVDLTELHGLIVRLLDMQMQSVQPDSPQASAPA